MGRLRLPLWSLIKQFFSPPFYSDAEKNRLSHILHLLLISSIFLAGGFALFSWRVASDLSGPKISAAMSILSLLMFWRLKSGNLRLVSYTLVISAFLAIMLSLSLNGGIRDEANLTLIALLAVAGFFLGPKAVLPLGFLAGLGETLLFFAERTGWLVEEEHFNSVAGDELMLSLIAVFATTFILYQISLEMHRSNRHIQAQAESLREKNHLLETTQISLERRTEELAAMISGLQETQQRLVAAKEQAESANRSRSQFFSNLSHDLRAPLNNIMGFTKALQEDDSLPPARKAEFLTLIHQSGEHLMNLINDLLDFSRLEVHQIKFFASPLHLRLFLDETVMMFQVPAQEKGLILQVQPASDLPEVIQADPQRLRQVLVNLVDNAIKFTVKGEIVLTVSCCDEGRFDGRPGVNFEVTDTGIGIAPPDIEKIFDPFVQVGPPQQGVISSGLGLAISRQLVQAMGGSLQVSSEPGIGTRFWFDLPYDKVIR